MARSEYPEKTASAGVVRLGSSLFTYPICLETVGQLPFEKTRHKHKPGCVRNTIFIFLNLNIYLYLFFLFYFFSLKICFVYITCYEEFELNKTIKKKTHMN